MSLHMTITAYNYYVVVTKPPIHILTQLEAGTNTESTMVRI